MCGSCFRPGYYGPHRVNSDPVHKPPRLSHSHGPAVGRRPTMGSKSKKRKLAQRKTKLGLPDLDHAKAAVLASLHSPESQRSYRHAIDEFVGWYCSEPRLSFNKTVVTRYRIHLEDRRLAPGTTNVRLAAVRRLADAPRRIQHRPHSSPHFA